MKKFLIVQPHSDDAILSCSRYLFNQEGWKVRVLTVEKNEKRLAEDAKISEIIGVKYSNLGVELMDDLYHDFFKEYGGNAELKEDNVLEFYVNRLGEEKVVELSTALNEKLDFFRSKGYQIICPLGVGHPFHYLVRMLIQNTDDFIFYRDFPHSYKRKANAQFVKETSALSAPEIFDSKEISELKYEIAQKCYKSQSGFFFYERSKILQNIPEEFYHKSSTTDADETDGRRIQIYVISKGRPNGKTFHWLRLGKVPYKVVVEPQDYDAYKKAGHEQICVLPENDRGFSYTVNYSKNQYDGKNPVVILDDDINTFYYSIDGQAKCGLSLKTEEELHEFFENMNRDILRTDFELGTIGKSAFDWNCEDISPKTRYSGIPVVIIINSPRLLKYDFDETLCFKSDIDYALKSMYLGIKYAKFVKYLQQTKMNKNVAQDGGLSETYKKTEKLIAAQEILLERWPDNVKVDAKKKPTNGVPELRITYKIFQEPAVISEIRKIL